MSTSDDKKKWYNVNLKDKINKSVKETKDFKIGLDENINRAKDILGKYGRKELIEMMMLI